MANPQKIIDEVQATFSHTLIVGNHDTITLFGVNEQNGIRDYSRKITNMLLQEHEDLDIAIMNILAEIERFDRISDESKLKCIPVQLKRKMKKREYIKMASYLEDAIQFFKLQQVQLIRENKMLEKWEEVLLNNSLELGVCIDQGKEMLSKMPENGMESHESVVVSSLNGDIDNWYKRLEKRINELMISRTISMQSHAQIKLMYSNNLMMNDKIVNILSNTIPVWRNQMAIALGIELLEKRVESQRKVLDTIEHNILSETSIQQKRQKRLNAGCQIKTLNQKLSIAIKDVAELQVNKDGLRNELLAIKDKVED